MNQANNYQPTTYAVYAIGCQQNWYDAEKIALTCDQLGLFPTKTESADLIIVLSCSVRQKAIDRLLGLINQWQKSKPRQILITACVLPTDRPKIAAKVTAIVPDQQIHQYLIKKFKESQGNSNQSQTKANQYQVISSPLNINLEPHHAFVPITLGCNNFCTFCAVPYTRGQEQSRPVSLILAEITKQIKNGKTAITLLGQNVNSFGLSDFNPRDLRKNKDRSGVVFSPKNPSPFVQLLTQAEKIKDLRSISFLSPNPQDISDDLITWMGQSLKFSHTLNLPLQSGSDRILKKMNRRYSQAEYLALVSKIRASDQQIILSTDIIVGFPDENEVDFAETLKVVQAANFAKVFIGIYSPRPGTVAAKLYEDNIPYATKHRRFSILNDLINLQPTKLNARTADRTQHSVLVK